MNVFHCSVGPLLLTMSSNWNWQGISLPLNHSDVHLEERTDFWSPRLRLNRGMLKPSCKLSKTAQQITMSLNQWVSHQCGAYFWGLQKRARNKSGRWCPRSKGSYISVVLLLLSSNQKIIQLNARLINVDIKCEKVKANVTNPVVVICGKKLGEQCELRIQKWNRKMPVNFA